MRFLLLTVVSAQPFYRVTLSQLQENLRQERIYQKVDQEVLDIQRKMVEEATKNHSSLNFTLYCIDPNRQYHENALWNKHLGCVPVDLIRTPHYTIPMTDGLGYYEYQREGPRYRYSTYEEREKTTELIWPRPFCEPKHGYALYQRVYGKLEDSHQHYTSLFFQKLNRLFPDIGLVVSNHRPSEGLYDSDCCPLFTVLW